MTILQVIRVTRPALIGMGMGISYSGIEQVWRMYKNPNRVQGGDEFFNFCPTPYVNYQFTLMSLQNTQKVLHI